MLVRGDDIGHTFGLACAYEDEALRQRYPGQRNLIVRIQGYVHLVPFVETDEHFCLKTIIPSRKENRLQTAPTSEASS